MTRADPGIFDKGSQGFPENVKYVEGKRLEADGNSYILLKASTRGGWGRSPPVEGVWGASPRKEIEISGSERCILVDPGYCFVLDNGESPNNP